MSNTLRIRTATQSVDRLARELLNRGWTADIKRDAAYSEIFTTADENAMRIVARATSITVAIFH